MTVLVSAVGAAHAASAAHAVTAAGALAQTAAPLATWTRTLEHQPVAEAVALVYPQLSPRGTVEVRPAENALVVRDLPATLARIEALLDDFDQPALGVRLAVRIVGAGPDDGTDGSPGLPPALVARLRELLRFESYRLIAQGELELAEGAEASHRLSGGYRVDFELGRLEPDRRIKLLGFRVFRGDGGVEAKPLIHTNINLRLGQPMVLGLARTESSERALMVVLNGSRPPAAVGASVEAAEER